MFVIRAARAWSCWRRMAAATSIFSPATAFITRGTTIQRLSLRSRMSWVEVVRKKLSTKSIAAFIVEPIQGEAGIRVPSPEYLGEAQALCRKYGTLFVLDEVQTGMYRTGRFLAGHQYGVEPDMVVLAKALSGGLIPSGAVLMSDAIYRSVYDSLKRAIVHTSTYSENGLAMRAGLATLQVFEEERLGDRALQLGEYLPG